MKPNRLIYFFVFLFFFIYSNQIIYSSDLFLGEIEEASSKKYSFSFMNNFSGSEVYSSDVVVIIVEKKEHDENGGRKIIKVGHQEKLQVDLPYDRIRVNVFISLPPTKVSPRKEYTNQEFLEKYGRLPSPRATGIERNYDIPEGYFITYKDIKLPYSINFTPL